tara:strand:- start:314 stop:1621 length:1308 start_codon:yes stop_codon:yes gene_type:complete
MQVNRQITRRRLIQTSAVVASGVFVNPSAAQESNSPNERLNIASIGCTGRAAGNLDGVASQNIVAIADIDTNLLEKGSARFEGAAKYSDFRELLDKEHEKIDAVVVSTPDHCHAPAAAMALRMKKHVYCEKPLSHTVKEARVLAELAKRYNLKTQMGTQIHAGDNYRRVVELVQSGAIGDVDRVHVWANAVYTGAKFKYTEKPANVNWDLWLGPAVERPYSEGVHPFNWRRFWDYGTGSLGDFGCHFMDLVHWALDLRNPTHVSAKGPEVDEVSTPAHTIVDYQYPKRGKLPGVHLTWYDSGKRPEILKTLKDKDGNVLDWGAGQLFIGSKGMILSNYGSHLLLPEEKFTDFKRPEQSIPKSIGHHAEWLKAIRDGGTTTCNFDYSGALTESVLLGTVAYRAGEAIEWDSKRLQVKNSEKAQNLIHKEYRKGWDL